jgi:hypothetical protein
MNNAVAALDLDDRIAAAFRDAPDSSDIAILITEVEAAALSSKEVAERARERAIDPALSAEDVADARQAMEDAAFACDRLAAAVPRLQQRQKELWAAEEDARRWVVYESVKAERDKLATELAEIYPAFARKMAELMPRIQENERQIEHLNDHARPGADALLAVELVARDLPSFRPKAYSDVPRITSRGAASVP